MKIKLTKPFNLSVFLIFLFISNPFLYSFSQPSDDFRLAKGFEENLGQIGDANQNLHPEVLYKAAYSDVTMFFKNNGIVYVFNKYETHPTKESIEAKQNGELVRAKILETKPMMFRMDLQFINTNPNVVVIPSDERYEKSNYYLAHCPDGITNVRRFNKITYKDIYPEIDLDYYFTEKGLKYDIIIKPGGNINDIKFKYIGSNKLQISNEGLLEIHYADGQKISEEKPVAFYANQIEQKIEFSYNNLTEEIGFAGENIDTDNTLIIDPSITWATYFHNTNSANSGYTNPEYDANGNFFLANQTYDNAYPLANPGGGAYYDATKTTMIKVAVLKFNSNRTLIWSTYYGGDNYDCLAGTTDYGKALALDNSGNVFVAGYTTSVTTIFPTQNPGGGAFYQDQSRCYGETSFFLKFNNNGVRQWATMFTHENASTSGTMIRVNGITCDGTNLYFTGQQYDWTPANTIPLRNPGGGAHYQSTILGSQDVFVGRFSSSQSLYWCTYLHSTVGTNTAFGQGLDLHCDISGNLFLVGRESGANSHHYLVNPGGGAYYQAIKGANGDLFITKFNTSLTAVWGTYYGGNGQDIPSTLEPDALGNIYIIGRATPSTDFPVQNPGGGALFQGTKSNAASDGFLIRFNSTTCARNWATYLGANVPAAGSDENHFSGIAFNTSNNNIFLSGYTKSTSMTTVNKAGSYNQGTNAGNYDMFFYELNSSGVVQWASYYGQSLQESAYNGRLATKNTSCGTALLSVIASASTNLTGVDPGNGAWYQGTTTFGLNDFMLELSDMSTPVPVSVSVSASANPICLGNNVTFTATPTNGGTPTYQWYLNGNPVGSNSSTYTTNTLANGNTVYCVINSSIACSSGNPATSNTITMTVNPNVAASVSVGASASTICSGTNVTFTATPINGGTPTYQWYLNGSPVGSNSPTYSNAGLTNGNTVYCVMTSTATCATGSPATSNTITMTVNPNVAASVSVGASASTICSGTNVTFTATPTNGGTPTYQWYLNGSPVGSNSSTYSNAGLTNGNTVYCVMTSTATCATGSPATSNTISMTVNPNLAASVSVGASASTICSGTNVTFTATPTNGGTPTYQWYLNGSPVGSNSPTYSNAGLTNGNTVYCVMTSTATCATGSPATSNTISMTVNPNLAASVSVGASASTICSGTNVTFTATPTNGGTPTYQWYLNGSPVGSNSPTYSNAGLTNGNTVYCVMTSTATCATGSPATSNTISMTVNPNLAASVSVGASASTICSGTNVTFTATPTNGGTPTYQWYLNGSPVGSNSPTYSNAGLTNGNTVYCVMTSTATCATGSPATSNTITMTVSSNLSASVAVSASSSTICSGTNVTFTATPTNGGTPTYQWYLNGNPVGSNSPTYSNAGLTNGNTVYCVMTSTATCATGSPATSNTITMIVNPNLAASVSVVASASTICSGTNVTFTATPTNGGTPTYQWYLNGSPVGSNSPTYSNAGLTNGNTVYCVMTSTATCATGSPATSNTITMTVSSNLSASVAVSASSSTICSGTNVTFTATPTNGGTPTYQWYLNGNPVGSNSPTYSNAGLTNGNTVYCIMTSSEACATGSPATSNTVTMIVNSSSTDPVSASANNSTICEGSSATLTVNGGSLGLGADWIWYSGGCGSGASIGNGSSISVSPASTSVYYVRAEGTCNNSACVSVVVNVTTAPDAGTNGIVSVCENASGLNLFSELGGTPTGGGVWTNSIGNPVSNMFDPSTQLSDVFTYTVSGTAPCADATSTVTVTVNTLPNVSFTGLSATYCGGSDPILLTGNQAPSGTFSGVDVTDNGNGTAGYTHATPGTYNITYSYTDGNGCSASDIQSVTIYSLPNVSFVGLGSSYCSGSGPVNIIGNQAPGGSFSGSGTIDNGNGTAVFNPINPGIVSINYSYTDGNGCTASDIQQAIVFENPTIQDISVTDVTVCSAPFNGEISVIASGGTGPYDYAINSGTFGSNNTFTGLNVGAYTISVLDVNGCSTDSMITVNSNTGFNIDSVSVINVMCFGDTSGQIVIHATNGVNFSIDNGSNYYPSNAFLNLGAGTYNVMAQDLGLCSDVSTINITEPSVLLLDTIVTNVSCGGNNGSAEVVVSGGVSGYTFLWSNDSTTAVISNISSGNYSVTVTDGNGCQDSISATVGMSGNILSTSTLQTDVDCHGNSTGEASVLVSGVGPFTYVWSTTDTTSSITGLIAGDYSVVVSDLFGCQGYDTVHVSEPLALSSAEIVYDISCNGQSNGWIDINATGGTPGYTYSWFPTGYNMVGDTYTGLPAGNYSFTITDAHGCLFTSLSMVINEPGVLTLNTTGNSPTCSGLSNGIGIANATGGVTPYVYLWSNGGQGPTVSNLSSGIFTVVVTDAHFCTVTDSLILQAVTPISYIDTIVNASCIGSNDGSVSLIVSGGNPPYVYAWNTNPVQTTSEISSLVTGTYELTITDGNNCQLIESFDVFEGSNSCIKIPTLFTPNNDGKNDVWEIEGIEYYPEAIVEIYNRWGDLIYKSKGYNDPWDGTYKGEKLPISSFVFILTLGDGSDPINGIVTIKR